MPSVEWIHPVPLALDIATILLVLAFAVSGYRLLRGPTMIDRIIALDLIAGLLLCVLAVFAVRFRQLALMDIGLTLAILSFLGTVAVARYLEGGAPKR